MRETSIAFVLLFVSFAPRAAAQELSVSERALAVSRMRVLAQCLEGQQRELERVLHLVDEAEQQRARARDERVRGDAERTVEALIARAAQVQRDAGACASAANLPSPGTRVVQRDPAPDPSADAVAEGGDTVRMIEESARLGENLTALRGEQVDGEGRLEPGDVRAAVRAIVPRLQRCYESYLDRGSIEPRQLDLVFTFRGSGAARGVTVERSGFADATFERCVRTAGGALRVARAPSGGDAIYSYALRFGR